MADLLTKIAYSGVTPPQSINISISKAASMISDVLSERSDFYPSMVSQDSHQYG